LMKSKGGGRAEGMAWNVKNAEKQAAAVIKRSMP